MYQWSNSLAWLKASLFHHLSVELPAENQALIPHTFVENVMYKLPSSVAMSAAQIFMFFCLDSFSDTTVCLPIAAKQLEEYNWKLIL